MGVRWTERVKEGKHIPPQSPHIKKHIYFSIETFANYSCLFFHVLLHFLLFSQEFLILSPRWAPPSYSSSPACIFRLFIIPMFPKLKAPHNSSSHTVNLSLQYVSIYARSCFFCVCVCFLRKIGSHYSTVLTHSKTEQ